LAQTEGTTILALPGAAIGAGGARPPQGITIVGAAQGEEALDVARVSALADQAGSVLVAALPLACLADEAVRSRFDAAITVGGGQVPAARAFRAARYDAAAASAGSGGRTAVPAWFLAGTDQSILGTKARLSSAHGPRLPFATRVLPMALPRIARLGREDLLSWRHEDPVLATATLLAALALAVASDPSATRIEAADLAAMMAAGTTTAERWLAERLLSLAEAYGRAAGDSDEMHRESAVARSRERRQRPRRSAPAMSVSGADAAPRLVRPNRC